MSEDFDNIVNKKDIAKNSNRAIAAIQKDLRYLSKIVKNKIMVKVSWTNFAAKNYLEAFGVFYELADGSALFINKREIYDGCATPKIKEAVRRRLLKEGFDVANDNNVKTAAKTLMIYWRLREDVAGISSLIRQYNEFDFVKENRWQINIPEKEFHFQLKRVEVSPQWKEKILKNSW